MKSSHFIPLGLLAAALLAGGCATETTRSGKNTYLMGGLVTFRTADFQPAGPEANQVTTTTWFGHCDPSGDSLSFFYDAVKYTDY